MLETLAREYVDLVDEMKYGTGYTVNQVREMDAQRLVLHDQLCELTGLPKNESMYQHCKRILIRARLEGRIP